MHGEVALSKSIGFMATKLYHFVTASRQPKEEEQNSLQRGTLTYTFNRRKQQYVVVKFMKWEKLFCNIASTHPVSCFDV